jgi:hypothetical protein
MVEHTTPHAHLHVHACTHDHHTCIHKPCMHAYPHECACPCAHAHTHTHTHAAHTSMLVLRMPSSGILCHVAHMRTDVSEEHSAPIIRVSRISELRIVLTVTINQNTVRKYYMCIVYLHSVLLLLVAANVLPSSPILVTLMMEAISSTEASVLTRARWHNILKDDILHSHCRENLKFYMHLLIS